MKAFEYISAESFDAAAAYLADAKSPTLVKAGGIDVVDRLKERLDTPLHVLNLKTMRRPKDDPPIQWGADGVTIGALATLSEIAHDARMQRELPAVATAAEEAATPQVRNVATLGGNLCQRPRCWYYRSIDFNCLKKGGSTCYAVDGDNRYHAVFGAGSCHIVHPSNMAMPLIGCGAVLKIVRWNDGKRVERTEPIEAFYRVPVNPQHDEHTLEAGELIESVHVPKAAWGPRSAYVELREKQSFDWPLVSGCADLNDRAKPRVLVGAVAPIPWRLAKIEMLIAGQALNDALIAKARAEAMKGAEPMSKNAYKVQLVGVAVERALRQADKAMA
jgi:xanthine dehydrogenase YagS FAD-binding subunit